MGFYFAGDIIGTDGLARNKHTVHARALQDTTICRIPINLVLQQPNRAQFFFNLISREIAHCQHHLAMITRTQAKTRLATLLLDIANRQADSLESLYMPIPRTDIASYLGLTVETVSRTLRDMEDNGTIQRNRKWIKIFDLQALQKLSYFQQA